MSEQTALVYRRPKWGRGMITADDARFLQELILEVRPQVAIEVGVASGCSSTAILDAMSRYRAVESRHAERFPNPVSGSPIPDPRSPIPALRSPIPDPRSPIPDPQSPIPSPRSVWLHAFDVAERCYFDPSRPTGAAVAELTPWNVPHYDFSVGDVLLARERLAGLKAPFAFIDANHLHPWATADLIGLLPCLAPGAWVALHDIRLPLIERRRGTRGHGPRHLFEAWPGAKRQGGSDDNIGAIQLPGDLSEVPALLRASLQQSWEVSLPDAVCSALSIAPRPVAVVPKPQALRMLADAAAQRRPVYVCGTGQAGRALAGELRRRDLLVTGFVDRDPIEHGAVLDGLPVESRRALQHAREPRPFMAVSGMFAAEIDAQLASAGWVRGADYVVL